jgi:hypothetical protein
MKAQILGFSLMIASIGITSASFAQKDTRFERNHPRREQVNNRLKNQDRRIHNEVKEGDISKRQAANLHKDDRSIRAQERRMASRDHGHLTPQDKARLNRRENRVSKRIGN